MKIFLDDERDPAHNLKDWNVARSFDQFVQIIHEQGPPNFVSFDHDLGCPVFDGLKCARTLIDMEMNGIIRLPDDFDWYVHSENPVGRDNINGLLNSYWNFRLTYFEGLKNEND